MELAQVQVFLTDRFDSIQRVFHFLFILFEKKRVKSKLVLKYSLKMSVL